MGKGVEQFDHRLVVVAVGWGEQEAHDEASQTDHTMQLVAKVKCQCNRWVRIRDNEVPTGITQCWNCGAELQIVWISHRGGSVKITYQGKVTTTPNVDVESLELP